MSHNVDTVHDISGDRETTLSDGSRLTLERSGIAWTVTVQEPGQERWKAKSVTFWPLDGGPAVLPDGDERWEDPGIQAEDLYEDVDFWDFFGSTVRKNSLIEEMSA